MDIVFTSSIQGSGAINVGQCLLADRNRVISMVGGIDDKRKVGDGDAVVEVGLFDVIISGFRENHFVIIGIRKLIVANA